MNIISTDTYKIRFKDEGYAHLNELVASNNYTNFYVLVDENTKKLCLTRFKEKASFKFEIIEIKSGEIHKNLDTCLDVWNHLTNKNADRNSLLINLGGGVITDMGGFIASTYKRGIDFVNIPTTLLSMVDASIGSKTGINLNSIKNQIGLFSDPLSVIVDTEYLKTLSKREINSGYAEIFKHSIISNSNFKKLVENPNLAYDEDIIASSIELKNKVVKKDKFENDVRKHLNFGHTIGHAVESLFMNKKNKLLHGEAIAIGMICESYISCKINGLDNLFCADSSWKKTVNSNKIWKKFFDENKNDIDEICNLIKYDKKNHLNIPKFVLLKNLGLIETDVNVDVNLIADSFDYYTV